MSLATEEKDNVIRLMEYAGFIPSPERPAKRRKRRLYRDNYKRAALNILKAYKEHIRRERGWKKFGWKRMRDLIMVHEDTLPEQLIPSPLLTKDHLQKWADGEYIIEDDQFYFVDRFIGYLRITEDYHLYADQIFQDIQINKKTVLTDMYSSADSYDDPTLEYFRTFINHASFYSEHIESENVTSVFIFFNELDYCTIDYVSVHIPMGQEELSEQLQIDPDLTFVNTLYSRGFCTFASSFQPRTRPGFEQPQTTSLFGISNATLQAYRGFPMRGAFSDWFEVDLKRNTLSIFAANSLRTPSAILRMPIRFLEMSRVSQAIFPNSITAQVRRKFENSYYLW